MVTSEPETRETAATPLAEIEDAVVRVKESAARLKTVSLDARMALTEECARGVAVAAREWVEAAHEAKRIPSNSSAEAEEILTGPVSVLRYLRLLNQSLSDIARAGQPHLPHPPRRKKGQWRVPVFPTSILYDRLLFRPLTAETWLEPEVSGDHLFSTSIRELICDASYSRDGDATRGSRDPELTGGGQDGRSTAPVVVVLGAGNVSAIPATDALTKIFQENKAVVLKMNPVNQYLGPVFERALAPLVDAGFLRIVYGGADVGSFLIGHDSIDEVHITGSVDTYDAIVWGPPSADRDARRTARQPLFNKPITSELGNVTPWAVLPGRYSDAELRFQAESVAASIVNNASFNCIATKMIITWKGWSDREHFLDLVEAVLGRVPTRFPYYPGACDRFATFAGHAPEAQDQLPWTLIRNADPGDTPQLFERESFVCVCAETALDADSPEQFLHRAVDFMNDRLWGTLAAAVTVPRSMQKQHAGELDEAIERLRYGTVGVNQWPGIAYALMSCPWGGFPGSDLGDVQSGIGFVHNTYFLDRPQKTVLYSPLKFWPKPLWFPTHRNAEAAAWKLLDLYRRPSLWRLPGLFSEALRG